MKNLLLLFFLATVTLVGCSNDDDNSSQDPLEGSWNLVRITGGIAGVTDSIPPNIITYKFFNGNLTVKNTNPEPDFSFLETGEYSYQLTILDTEQVLLIENRDYQVFSLEANAFDIGDPLPVNDGFNYEFER
ncbi:hypothetical protein [Rasiella sp. SM2506]|uniref:hypothetical protein n=1 Tax=Rasiella sp. SM2506 TaxID=3423914 RepID=UPI003D7A6621